MSKTEQQRQIPANLIEATPGANGLGYWVLASPFLIFLAWTWISLFAAFSPFESPLINSILGGLLFIVLIVLPFGYAMFYLITTFPRVFQHAGWEIQPLEPVREVEKYLVKYRFAGRQRAKTDLNRILLRVAQGWVFLEIAAIFIGAILMIPLFFSAVQFGFGQ